MALTFVPGIGAGVAVARVAITAYKIAKVARAGGDLGRFRRVGKLTSDLAGKMYVGRGSVAGARGARISRDGLRMYRPPVYKKHQKMVQSNFQARGSTSYKWSNKNRPGYYNGHLKARKW